MEYLNICTFTGKELLVFNKFIEENDYTVLKFLKVLGAKINYSYIKGDTGFFEGSFKYKNEIFVFKVTSNKREITSMTFM